MARIWAQMSKLEGFREMAKDKENEKEHDGKGVVVIVNGEEQLVDEKELTFDQVVEFAFPGAIVGPNTHLTITYRFRRGKDAGPEDVMVRGERVEVQKGMIFNVTLTDKS